MLKEKLNTAVSEKESTEKSLALEIETLNDKLADTEDDLQELQSSSEKKMKELETALEEAKNSKDDAVNMWKTEYEQIYTTLLKMTNERKEENDTVLAELRSVSR